MVTSINLVAIAAAIQLMCPKEAAWLRHLAAAVQEKKQ